MARTPPALTSFNRMVRDVPRNQLPEGACWTLQDTLPNLGAQSRGRGGYRYYSDAITGVVATTQYVTAGVYADQFATPKLLVIDEDGRLIQVKTDGTGDIVDVGAANLPLQNPVQLNALVVIPGNNGATAPKKYDGTTIATLGGSPPNGIYAASWKALLVLANTSAEPQRAYFSVADYDPEQWDLVNAFWDFSFPIRGIAPMRNSLLFFHDNYTSRLRGSTPPPGGDMIADDPLFNIGIADARSIATWNEQVVWAATDGLYITDGSIPNDLTQLCGMKSYWQDTVMPAYAKSTYTVVGGVIRNHYIVSVMDGATLIDAAKIDLQRYSWVKLTNVKARSMWRTTSLSGSENLFFGNRDTDRVSELSSIFTPSATYKNDANGTAVTQVVESPFYEFGPGLDSLKSVYVTYDLRDAATDNPTFAVSYATAPEATSYTSIGTLAETTARARKRLRVGKSGLGFSFKIAQANASSDSRLWALELQGHAREQSRLS